MSSLVFYDAADQVDASLYLIMDSNDRWLKSIESNVAGVFGVAKPFLKTQFMDMIGSCAKMDDPGLNYTTLPIVEEEPFDFIYIDGRRRLECALVAALMSHDDTIIIQHDYIRPRYQPSLLLFEPIEDNIQFRASKIRKHVCEARDEVRDFIVRYVKTSQCV